MHLREILMTFANSLLLIKQDSLIKKEYHMWYVYSLKHEIFSKLEVVVHLQCTEACAKCSLEQEDEDEGEDYEEHIQEY